MVGRSASAEDLIERGADLGLDARPAGLVALHDRRGEDRAEDGPERGEAGARGVGVRGRRSFQPARQRAELVEERAQRVGERPAHRQIVEQAVDRSRDLPALRLVVGAGLGQQPLDLLIDVGQAPPQVVQEKTQEYANGVLRKIRALFEI